MENITITNNRQNVLDIINYAFQVKKKASLKTTFVSLGKQILKNDIRIDLIGKKAKADIGGLYLSKANSITDYNIKVNHLAKKTLSKQFFKGILNKDSKASFTGRVKIEKDCIDCKSEQVNNNLIYVKGANNNYSVWSCK